MQGLHQAPAGLFRANTLSYRRGYRNRTSAYIVAVRARGPQSLHCVKSGELSVVPRGA